MKGQAPRLDDQAFESAATFLDYFLKQWEQFEDVPLGVLAHSTHVRGDGVFEHGVEKPRATVTLASRIPEEDCRRLNLGYLDPDTIDLDAWREREDDEVLFVEKAGEKLYRTRSESA